LENPGRFGSLPWSGPDPGMGHKGIDGETWMKYCECTFEKICPGYGQVGEGGTQEEEVTRT